MTHLEKSSTLWVETKLINSLIEQETNSKNYRAYLLLKVSEHWKSITQKSRVTKVKEVDLGKRKRKSNSNLNHQDLGFLSDIKFLTRFLHRHHQWDPHNWRLLRNLTRKRIGSNQRISNKTSTILRKFRWKILTHRYKLKDLERLKECSNWKC